MKIQKICPNCSSEFHVFPSRYRQRFCTNACLIAQRKGDKHPRWKGGLIQVGGYLYKYSPHHPNKTKDGYVAQHRLVMESVLGRLLLASEVVHHLNGDKMDNRPINLAVCRSTGEHFIQHHLETRDKLGRFK